jgi:hypothetical protein
MGDLGLTDVYGGHATLLGILKDAKSSRLLDTTHTINQNKNELKQGGWRCSRTIEAGGGSLRWKTSLLYEK